MTATSDDTKSSTSSDGSTKGRQLKLSAQRKLSKLRSQLSEIESLLKANPDPSTKTELLKLLDEIDRYSKTLAIEKRLVQLTSKQIEIVDAWMDDTSAVVASLGGNRSGKTFGLAAAIAYDIREEAPANVTYLCVAKDSAQSVRNQQRELWELLPQEKIAPAYSGIKNGFGTERPLFVYDPGGRNITVLFMTQSQYDDNWQAFEGITTYRVWCDESVSDGCFAALGRGIATMPNAKIGLSTIPDDDWIEDLMAQAEVDDSIFIREFLPTDNPAMDQAKQDRLKLFVSFGGEDMQAMRLEGKPLVAGSRVYTEFDRKKHVITHKEFLERSKGDVCWYAGLDSGMDHPTVWLLVAVDRDGTKYVVKEHASRNATPEQDVRQILALLGERTLVWPTVADPAMWQNKKLGMEALHYKKAGLTLTKALRTQQFGEDYGVEMIKDLLLGERLSVCEECKTLISNFHKWKYKRDREGNSLEMDRYVDKDNDALDALRYIITKKPRYQTKYPFIGIDYND